MISRAAESLPRPTPVTTIRTGLPGYGCADAGPALKPRFAVDATDAVGSTPEEISMFLKSEVVRRTRVAREADIRAD
jgi:hypothetical protein